MNSLKRKITIFTVFVVWLMTMPLVAVAQKITVQGPTAVNAGTQFYLQYVVNTTDVKGFRVGNIPDAFDVLMGPSRSVQQSISFVNGSMSQTSSVTYTYVLMAVKNGTFVIPPAHATIDGKAVNSQALKITVSGTASQQGTTQRQQPQRQQHQRVDRAGSRISANDLFIKVTANKQRVHEQEPILLTYKVYTLVELTQLQGKMPDLNGFHTQEIPLPQQKTFHVENVNGRPYNCVTWSQYVMFPQMTGKLEIPSITFNGIVMQQNPDVDPFEAFFNGGSGYVEVKKEIKAPGLTVQVDPLPQKPANFSGGVGTFNVSASLDKNTVKAGDPVSVRFVVTGTGNMKLIKAPELELPKDFDKYDPKITDKTKLTAEGITGSLIYDMLIVPRNKGSYTIPSMQFVYFDTKTSAFKTLTTAPMQLTVEKGSGKPSAVADYSRPQDNDISDILVEKDKSVNLNDLFFDSWLYTLLNGIVIVTFIALFLVFRKRAMALSDIAAMRGKRASKVATKRLKKAAKLLRQGKDSEFYDEVMRALWGYVGDKLTIPVERLSRENISQRLSDNGIGEVTINSFIEAIDECEYARYAPGDSAGNMQKTYDKATTAIMNIEDNNTIKKSNDRKDNGFHAILLLILLISLGSMHVYADGKTTITSNQQSVAENDVNASLVKENTDNIAVMKANADAAYRSGDYQKAIVMYEQILKLGVSASLYHNLGNAYYRTDNIPQAIWCYEKAKKLSPVDERIQHSIDIARNKTIDKLPPESEVILVKWYLALRNSFAIDSWAVIALTALIVALLLFLAYLFMENMLIRHMSFYASMLLLVVFLLSNIFAWRQHVSLTTHDHAVIISPLVNVKTSPTVKSPDACVIHEGTTVTITDNEMKGWYGIKLSDEREGWVRTADVKEF